MECVDHKVISPDGPLAPNIPKRHSRGRILNFLGSSTEFFRGKLRKGNHASLDSDPGITAAYLRYNATVQQNGHIGKRLVRGETIDTASTDESLDCDKNYQSEDDFSRHNTFDSSAFGDGSNDSPASDPQLRTARQSSEREETTPDRMVDDQQDDGSNYRKLEASPIIRRPNSLSVDPSAYRSSHIEDDFV